MEMAAAVDQCKGWPPFFLLLLLIFNQPLPMALNHKRMKTNPNDPISADPGRAAVSTFSNQDPLSLPEGLTKREYFAAMALTGIMTMVANGRHSAPGGEVSVAETAVRQADALIEALNKEG